VIGGGPAGLMAAERLLAGGAAVTLFDRLGRPGQKLLKAGRGGLNLTHSEPLPAFLARYGTATRRLAPAIEALPPQAVRAWCEALGEPTFVGSSGRVFPRSMKASPLLRAWLGRLAAGGVAFRMRRRWMGWDAAGALRFEAPTGTECHAADATVLALGGASWPRLGSDGAWTAILRERGVAVLPLRPANCGFAVPWSPHFRARFPGTPLKTIALTFGEARVRGEAMVTAAGIEGGAVYALSAAIRDAIERGGAATVGLDLKPDTDEAALARRLAAPRGSQTLSSVLRKRLGLPPVAVALLHEADAKGRAAAPAGLAALVKSVPLRLTAPFSIEQAISSAGGLALDELDAAFMLRRLPGVFAAGEMLDWEAPTGGYLLQACLATGAAAAEGALAWLDRRAG
jgi:hypothetical protein